MDPSENDDEEEEVEPKSTTVVDPSILNYLDAPSDLLPGVYEGGLKTWECSVDLAGIVKDRFNSVATQRDNLRVLEVGHHATSCL